MTTGKSTAAIIAAQLIVGAKKHFASATSLAYANTTRTPAEIETSLQTLIDLRNATDSAQATARAKVDAEEAQAPALQKQMAAFIAFVKVTFGDSPEILSDFGLEPRKAPTPLTVEQKTAAAAKRKATRALRHTMGPVQKKKVKTTATPVVTVTIPTAPQPTVSSPEPTTPPAAPATGTTPRAS
jgi:hypothetical protein